MSSQAPNSVSRLLCQLAASRHFTSGGAPCLVPGAAPGPGAGQVLALVRNDGGGIGLPSSKVRCQPVILPPKPGVAPPGSCLPRYLAHRAEQGPGPAGLALERLREPDQVA